MAYRKRGKDFFQHNTHNVAQRLVGAFLVRKKGRHIIKGMITETESYHGPNDLASHASRGRTQRTEIMFGPAGYYYVYLIYGMYHCLNIVTGPKDFPAAVLIRAVTVDGVDNKMTNGPGKLCRFFSIDKKFNGMSVANDRLWIQERALPISLSRIKKTTRVGVGYAGKWKEKKWRYVLTDA